MSKKLYCSVCGAELELIRKAIPDKGFIADMVRPHECEGYAIKGCPEGKETLLEIIEGLKPLTKPKKVVEEKKVNAFNLSDSRDSSVIKSSAPDSLLKMVSD